MFAAIDAGNERILWAAGERRRLLAAARRAWRSGDKAAHRAARAELAGLPPHRRTVGAATMQRIRATLRSALADAVRQGLVTVNVAKPAKLKTGKRPNALVWGTERVTAWQTAYERELAADRERAGGRHPRCCLHGVMVTMMPIGAYNALTIRADRRSGRFLEPRSGRGSQGGGARVVQRHCLDRQAELQEHRILEARAGNGHPPPGHDLRAPLPLTRSGCAPLHRDHQTSSTWSLHRNR